MFDQFPIDPVNGESINLGSVQFLYNAQYDTWAPSDIELPFNVASDLSLSSTFIGTTRQVIYPKSLLNELVLWSQIRFQRNAKFESVQWRYERYARHARLGLPQVDNIADLDAYCQALADITTQADPSNIAWPLI
jgi:hypothetical protein